MFRCSSFLAVIERRNRKRGASKETGLVPDQDRTTNQTAGIAIMLPAQRNKIDISVSLRSFDSLPNALALTPI